MFNVSEKNNLMEAFSTEVIDAVSASKDLNVESYMEKGEVDLVRDCIFKIQNILVSKIPEGVPVPKVSLYITPTGVSEIDLITISISNKITGKKKFKFQSAVTKKNALKKITNFFVSSYVTLMVDDMAEENLVAVNKVLEKATQQANVSYSVKVTTPMGNEGKKIASISDDEIVFVADADRVFALEDVLVLSDVTEFVTQEMIDKAIESEVAIIATAQTPEQLVEKRGGALLAYLCDISKQVKPFTLLKKVCTKDVHHVRGNKDTLAYFKDGDVFALVVRRDGHWEVVLSPFDIKTLRKVDRDILKEI